MVLNNDWNDKSRMNREVHVRFCERLRLKCLCLLDFAICTSLPRICDPCRSRRALIKLLKYYFHQPFFSSIITCRIVYVIFCSSNQFRFYRIVVNVIWMDYKSRPKKCWLQISTIVRELLYISQRAGVTQRGYESLLTHYYKVSPHYQSSPLFPIV